MSTVNEPTVKAELEKLSSKDDIMIAGRTLLMLAEKDSDKGRRKLFHNEMRIIDESFSGRFHVPQFREYVTRALKKALKTQNYELARALLEKDETNCLLQNEYEVLQLTLSIEEASDEQLDKIVPLLIKHGAAINTRDHLGNTPLYYACFLGLSNVFIRLINCGANYKNHHNPFPLENQARSFSEHSADQPSLVNLLQVTLNACVLLEGRVGTTLGASKPMLDSREHYIINWLIDAGFTVPDNDPSLSRVFHVACFHGNLGFMKKLLHHGVDIEAKPSISGTTPGVRLRPTTNDISFSSALHAAAYGGHEDAVTLLLQLGADPCSEGRQLYGLMSGITEPLTPLAAAFENLRSDILSGRTETDDFFGACIALVDAGAGYADKVILLEKAAGSGKTDIVRRLLANGVLIDEIPSHANDATVRVLLENNVTARSDTFSRFMLVNKSVDVLETFIRTDSDMDVSQQQRMAASLGALDALKRLIKQHGPAIQVEQDMGHILQRVIMHNDMDMLRYLAFEYLDDVNTIFNAPYTYVGGGSSEPPFFNALAVACEELNVEAVRILLEGGVDVGCPSLPYKAYLFVLRRTDYKLQKIVQIKVYQMIYLWETEKSLDKCYHNSNDNVVFINPPPKMIMSHIKGFPKQFIKAPHAEDVTWKRERIPLKLPEDVVPAKKFESDEFEEDVCDEDLRRAEAEVNSEEVSEDSDRDMRDFIDYDEFPQEGYEDEDSEEMNDASDRRIYLESLLYQKRPGAHTDNDIPNFIESQPPKIVRSRRRGRDFSYQALSGLYEIRILRIHPSKSPETPIQCSLGTFNLAAEPKPRYEALSYVWGAQTNAVNISLNDSDFTVTENLWAALHRLRLKDETRLLWVDAICINQNHVPEKNQQVSIMREIYRGAWRVVVWLGEEGEDSHLVFTRLASRKNRYTRYYPTIQTWTSDDGHVDPSETDNGGRGAAALEKLCRRPWFFRTWIIQEIALNRDQEAIVMCGGHKMDWWDFPELDYDDPRLCSPLRETSGTMHLGDLQSLSASNDWRHLLQTARNCGATDPRDKIYGLMGLYNRQIMPIDYSLSVEEIFRRFTAVYLEESGDLSIFHFFPRLNTPSNAPSWIVDFGDSHPVRILPRTVGKHRLSTPGPSDSSRILPGWQCTEHDLMLRGKHAATIDFVSSELQIDPLMRPHTDTFRNVVQDWELTALQLSGRKKFARSIADAFAQTLIAFLPDPVDDAAPSNKPFALPCTEETEEFSRFCHAFCRWYAKHGSGVLRLVESDYFDQVLAIGQWFLQSGDWEEDDFRLGGYEEEVEAACYGRKMFTTSEGSLGLAPPDAQVGDQLVFFPGAMYPFVLRDRTAGGYSFVGDCYLFDFDEYEFCKGIAESAKTYTIR